MVAFFILFLAYIAGGLVFQSGWTWKTWFGLGVFAIASILQNAYLKEKDSPDADTNKKL
jgi:hypothetical protein